MSNESNQVSLLSKEEDFALGQLSAYQRIVRSEQICSVHWPQFNWKLLRSEHMDLFGNDGSCNMDEWLDSWFEQMGYWLYRGKSSVDSISELSSGESKRLQLEEMDSEEYKASG